MSKCQFCGKKFPDDVAACPKCGAKVLDHDRKMIHDTADEPTEPEPGEEPPADEFEEQLLALLREGKKIPAIKLYREETGAGLKDAKDAVETLGAQHGIKSTGGCAGIVALAIVIGGSALACGISIIVLL